MSTVEISIFARNVEVRKFANMGKRNITAKNAEDLVSVIMAKLDHIARSAEVHKSVNMGKKNIAVKNVKDRVDANTVNENIFVKFVKELEYVSMEI